MVFARSENYEEYLEQFNKTMVQFMKAMTTNELADFPEMELNFFLKAKAGSETLKRNGFKVREKENN